MTTVVRSGFIVRHRFYALVGLPAYGNFRFIGSGMKINMQFRTLHLAAEEKPAHARGSQRTETLRVRLLSMPSSGHEPRVKLSAAPAMIGSRNRAAPRPASSRR